MKIGIGLGLGLTINRRGGGVDPLADFYVDSVNGSDANDGRTPETALETLAALETAALADGVRIGLAAGSDFNEGNIDLSSPVGLTLAGYGNLVGAGLPRIRSEAVFDAFEDNTDRGDGNDKVYSQDVAITTDVARPCAYENATVLKWVASEAACQAEPGTFFVEDGSLTAGTHTIFVHPSDSGDPSSNGKTYTFSQGAAPIFGDNATLRNIKFGRQAHRNGVRGGSGLKASNLLLDQVSPVHSLLFQDGDYRRIACWQDWDDVREGAIAIEFYRDDGRGYSCSFRDIVFVGSQGSVQSQNAIGGHVSGTVNLYDSVEVDGIAIQDGRVDLASFAASVVLNRSRVKRGLVSVQNHTTADIIDLWAESEAGAQYIVRFTNDGSNTVDGMRSFGDASNSLIRDPGNSCSITRSVFARDGGAQLARIVDKSAATDLLLRGNIYDTNGHGNYTYHARVTSLDAASDNNVYDGSVAMTINGSSYSTVPALNAGTGTDANSVLVDPQLTDPANGDFTPQAEGLPANSGLERDPTCQNYTPIPESLAEAEAWILGL